MRVTRTGQQVAQLHDRYMMMMMMMMMKNLKIFIIHPVTNTLNRVMFTLVSNHHTFRFLCFFNIATHNLKSFSVSMTRKLQQLRILKQFTIFMALFKILSARTDKHNKISQLYIPTDS
jgi:hypothetical protein